MSELNDDDNVERLLHEYFSAELDGQVGRAGAGFRLHLLQARAAERGAALRRRRRMTSGWAVGIVGSAVAASVAVMAAAPAFWRNAGPSSGARDEPLHAAPAEPVTYTQVVGQTIDEGTFLVDGRVPVRKLRRERVEQAMWYDAEMGAQVQVFVPREDVMFVEMATY
jgi:hypothetical protein